MALLVVTSGSVSATEVAVLRNGFTIRHERHEQAGDMTRLYLTEAPGSYVDVPTDQVVGFEADDYAPPAQVSEAIPASAPVLGEVVRAAAASETDDGEEVAASGAQKEPAPGPRPLELLADRTKSLSAVRA